MKKARTKLLRLSSIIIAVLVVLTIPSFAADDARAFLSGENKPKLPKEGDQNILPTPPSGSMPNVDSGNIEEQAVRAFAASEEAQFVRESAVTRPKEVIDPDDPLFQEGSRLLKNPEKALNSEMRITPEEERAKPVLRTCFESGGSYQKTCRRYLSMKVNITPEIKVNSRHCPGHKRGMWWWKSKKYCTPGCQVKTHIKQKRRVDIVEEKWIDECKALEALSDQGACRYVSVTKGGPETRVFTSRTPHNGTIIEDSESITRPCFEERYTYECGSTSEDTCQQLKGSGCRHIQTECVEYQGTVCTKHKKTYDCGPLQASQNRTQFLPLDESGGDEPFCITGDCMDSTYEANNEMMSAMAHLSAFTEMQKDIQAQLGIFRGQSRQCRKYCLDFNDCCSVKGGWGETLRLDKCNGEERELADWRQKKRCVLVGTFCAKKVLGECVKKKTTFCCFGTKLSKLIQEHGRRQLGLNFGSPKHPNCRALSPEELSRINLSEIDLSDAYEDIQNNMRLPTKDHFAKGVELERIRENMKHLKTVRKGAAA